MDIAAYVRRAPDADITRSVLQDIAEGTVHSPFILILDSAVYPCHELLGALSARGARVLEAADLQAMDDSGTGLVLLRDLTVELVLHGGAPGTLISNRGTPGELVFNRGALGDYLQSLHRKVQAGNRGSEKVTLVANVQTDILPAHVVADLLYIADTTIETGPEYRVTHRSVGGRGRRETCILSRDRFVRTGATKIVPAEAATILPSSTFNLGMTAEQAAAKANVVLPHLRVQQQQETAASRPILAEDYDEEDPDDDLEF